MNFLNLINTARCSECDSKQFHLQSKIIPAGMKDTLSNESGRERIMRMFTENEYGFSPELRYVIQTSSVMAAFAAVFGGLKEMNVAKDNFFRRNVASTFENEFKAKRNLTDSMALAGINGAWRTALKYGSFTTFYLLGTMTVANYRNKISPWEHTATAALLGGLSRLNYGVKGFSVAAGLGGFLGFIAGGIITLSMKLSGVTLEELRYYQHEDHYARILRKRRKEAEMKKKEEEQ